MLTFLLLSINQREAASIVECIKKIDKGVEEKLQQKINHIFEVFGEYDLVVKIKSHDEEDARTTIQKIKSIKGVYSANTLVVVHASKATDQPAKGKIIYH